MTPLEWVIGALVTYRISRMVGNRAEEGPFSLLSRARTRLRVNEMNTWWRRGLACPMCVSFWVGPLVALLLGLNVRDAVVVGLSFSGVAVVLVAIAG